MDLPEQDFGLIERGIAEVWNEATSCHLLSAAEFLCLNTHTRVPGSLSSPSGSSTTWKIRANGISAAWF